MFNDKGSKKSCQQLLQLVTAVTLVMLFSVACGDTATTAVSEAPASTPTEASTTNGPRTGEIAPDFALPDSNGNMVRLADQLKDNRLVVLVFYHSHY